MLFQNASPGNSNSSSNTKANTAAINSTLRNGENPQSNQNPNVNSRDNSEKPVPTASTTTQTPVPKETPNAGVFTDGWYVVLLLVIALAIGAFGGFVNYLILTNEKKSTDNENAEASGKFLPQWVRHIFLGIAAALLVPLFLHTISSQLLSNAHENYLLLLVFAGFCLVAAMSAKTFITTLSSKVLQEAQEAKDKAQRAEAKAENAQSTSLDAKGNADSAKSLVLSQSKLFPATADTEARAAISEGSTPEQTEQDLIAEYDTTRENDPSGYERTSKMGEIFRNMIQLMPNLGSIQIADYLNEKTDNGKRLFGYAYFFYKPDIQQLALLVDSVVNIETTSFGQYWGILAIGKVISGAGTTTIDPDIITKLKTFYTTLKPGTDRWKELKTILEQLKQLP